MGETLHTVQANTDEGHHVRKSLFLVLISAQFIFAQLNIVQ